MKVIHFVVLLIITLAVSCVKSLPPVEETEIQDGEILVLFNDTGDSRFDLCDEGTDLTFELSSGNEYRAIDVPAGNFYLAVFKIKSGERLSITVKDAKTQTKYTSQNQVISLDVNIENNMPNLPLQSIRVCPRDKIEFINF